jgi:hypothetical protein
MTERAKIEAHWGYKPFVLKSGVVAEKGKLACLDTTESGKVVAGKASTTLVPIGWFMESFTGDGVKTISVMLFDEIRLAWWDNDGGAPLAASDILHACYILDDHTVTATATGHSLAGVVMGIDSAKGVLVYSALPLVLAPLA